MPVRKQLLQSNGGHMEMAMMNFLVGCVGLEYRECNTNGVTPPATIKQQTTAVDKTLAEADSGVITIVTVDAKIVTLPPTVVGMCFTIMNGGANGAVLVTVAPDAADKIMGAGFTSADN